jgi:hypothetical protein
MAEEQAEQPAVPEDELAESKEQPTTTMTSIVSSMASLVGLGQ